MESSAQDNKRIINMFDDVAQEGEESNEVAG